MTIFTRENRIPKRDAYLLQKHNGDPQGLLTELRDHAVREPFSFTTATVEELSERYKIIVEYSRTVLRDFPYEAHKNFPDLSGTPVAFIPKGDSIEVILRRNTAIGEWNKPAPTPKWSYRSVMLPQSLFLKDVSRITSWTRKTIRKLRDDLVLAELRRQEAEERRIKAERDELDRKLVRAQETLAKFQAQKDKLSAA